MYCIQFAFSRNPCCFSFDVIINSYLIRRALCSLDTSSITRLFPALLKDTLEDCDGNYSNIVEVLKKNLVNKNAGSAMYMPNDVQLRDLILNANM